MDAENAIQNSSIFSGLDEKELADVLSITAEKNFAKGDIIMQEGEKEDSLYLIVNGEVDVSKSLTMKFEDDDFRETEKVLTHYGSDDNIILGEMALIKQDSRSASVLARTDCTLLEIKRDVFIKLVEGRSELGVKILFKLSELLIDRLKQSSQDITRLTTALSIALSR